MSYFYFSSRLEQTYIETLLEDTYELMDIWTGLNDRNGSNKIRGKYSWSDNGPVTYTNWYNNQPDESSRTSSCVKMSLRQSYRGGLSWLDDGCSMRHAFICKKLKSKFLGVQFIIPWF